MKRIFILLLAATMAFPLGAQVLKGVTQKSTQHASLNGKAQVVFLYKKDNLVIGTTQRLLDSKPVVLKEKGLYRYTIDLTLMSPDGSPKKLRRFTIEDTTTRDKIEIGKFKFEPNIRYLFEIDEYANPIFISQEPPLEFVYPGNNSAFCIEIRSDKNDIEIDMDNCLACIMEDRIDTVGGSYKTEIIIDKHQMESNGCIISVQTDDSHPREIIVDSNMEAHTRYVYRVHHLIVPSLKLQAKWFLDATYAFAFNPQHSFGLTTGLFFSDKWGWWVGCQTNLKFARQGDYSVEGTESLSELPILSGERNTTRVNLSIGIIYRIRDRWCPYFGLGYGNRTMFWNAANSQSIKVVSDSYEGLAVEAGTIFLISERVNMMFGVNSINFNYWEAKVGFGIRL